MGRTPQGAHSIDALRVWWLLAGVVQRVGVVVPQAEREGAGSAVAEVEGVHVGVDGVGVRHIAVSLRRMHRVTSFMYGGNDMLISHSLPGV